MLMQNKLEPKLFLSDMEIDLTPVRPALSEAGEDAQMKQRQLWEIIVRMHYLAHELRDPALDLGGDLGVPPAFTRLVSGLLSEWAVMAEEAAQAAEEVAQARDVGLMSLRVRGDHH